MPSAEVLHQPVEFIWHQSEDLSGFDAIILPGGFSYGDYLRTGAIARFSPVMRAVERFARSGGLVLGICNGFQILCEAGLLPGALMRNQGLRFICRQVHVRVETTATPFTSAAARRPGAAPSDRPCRRKLFLRRGHARRTQSATTKSFFAIARRRRHRTRGESERLARLHRRHLQPRTQCAGPDAASGARRGSGAGSTDGLVIFRSLVQSHCAATRRCRELDAWSHAAHMPSTLPKPKSK